MSISHFLHLGEDFSTEIAHGISGIVKTMWHGVERVAVDVDVFHFKRLQQSWKEKWYLVEDASVAVYDIFTSNHTGPLLDIITDVLSLYNGLFPQAMHEKELHLVASVSGYSLGRYAIAPALVKSLANKIAQVILIRLGAIGAADAASFSIPFLGLVVTALTIEGFMDRADKANDRLQANFPELYLKLKKKHLNMLFFLVEIPMKRYLSTIHYAKMFPLAFKRELESFHRSAVR